MLFPSLRPGIEARYTLALCNIFIDCSNVVLVAEVTQVSMGVGYEIGRAVSMGKKTLCLYRPQSDKSECKSRQKIFFSLNLILAFLFTNSWFYTE